MITDSAWIKFGKSMLLLGGVACILQLFVANDDVANFYLRGIVAVYGAASLHLFWSNR